MTDPGLDRMLRDYLREEQGPQGTRARIESLAGDVRQHLVDDERRHGEVLRLLENHAGRIASLGHRADKTDGRFAGTLKWVGGIAAALIVSAVMALAARFFIGG